jgi:hypothetical protein
MKSFKGWHGDGSGILTGKQTEEECEEEAAWPQLSAVVEMRCVFCGQPEKPIRTG